MALSRDEKLAKLREMSILRKEVDAKREQLNDASEAFDNAFHAGTLDTDDSALSDALDTLEKTVLLNKDIDTSFKKYVDLQNELTAE